MTHNEARVLGWPIHHMAYIYTRIHTYMTCVMYMCVSIDRVLGGAVEEPGPLVVVPGARTVQKGLPLRTV